MQTIAITGGIGSGKSTFCNKLKEKGFKIVERKIKLEELKNFEACFLTGTAAEITPVSQISNYNFKVCNVISDLNDEYQNLVRKDSAA